MAAKFRAVSSRIDSRDIPQKSLSGVMVLAAAIAYLFASVIGCQLDGQVTGVSQLINMADYPLKVGYDEFVDNYFNVLDTGIVTPQGYMENQGTGQMFLQCWRQFTISDRGETHFRNTVSYASVNLTDGPSADPREGGLYITYQRGGGGVSFGWYLTDLKVYAYISWGGAFSPNNFGFMSWFIPVADREPDETAAYEIVVSKSAATISMRMNGRELFRVKGRQGIDSKFRVQMFPQTPPPGMWPRLTSESFSGLFINIIGLAQTIDFGIQAEFLLPPCLNTTYNQCIDRNPSYAPNAHCVYTEPPVLSPNATYTAQFDQLQVFVIEKTQGCPKEELPFAPWRRCPCKDDQEETIGVSE